MKHVITLRDVETAHQHNREISVDENTIVTPYARDRAKELQVALVKTSEKSGTGQLSSSETQTVALGADHGGFALKEELKQFLREKGYTIIDVGTNDNSPCDYPDFAFKVAQTVARGQADRGIMIDSVGIGSAMAANRVPGILAAKCNNVVEAKSAREHNYANVLTLGAKIIGSQMAREIVQAFLTTPGGAERHQKRVNKILNYSEGASS
jgi:ribose 5-phosphate isomerase B